MDPTFFDWFTPFAGWAFHSWLNIIFSFLGYLLFGLLCYSCYTKGMIKNRMHDVLLILLVALAADLLETGQHVYSLISTDRKAYVTQVCTVPFWIIFLHFQMIFVVEIISIHRTLSHDRGKTAATSFVYIGIGAAFALQTLIFVASPYIFSDSENKSKRTQDCQYADSLQVPLLITIVLMILALPIAPFHSLVLIIKGFVRREEWTGVSAFLLCSSLPAAVLATTATLTTIKTMFDIVFSIERVLEWQIVTWTLYGSYVVAYVIEDFRFPILCMLAMLIVKDIRGAASSTYAEAFRKWRGYEAASSTENGVPLEIGVKENK